MLSAESVKLVAASNRQGRWDPRWLALAWILLLVAEILALSFSFDINLPAVANQPSVIARGVAHSAILIRVGVCLGTAAAAILLGSARMRCDLIRLFTSSIQSRVVSGWLVVHLACYVVFFAATARLIAAMGLPGDPALEILVLLWIAGGAATLSTWLLVAMPASSWWQLLRMGWQILLAGLLIGVLAIETGAFTGRLWLSFHDWTFTFASALLRRIDPAVICRPETYDLGSGNFTVNIAPVCSGFEGIGLIWALLGGYLVVCRRDLRFPQAFLLLPLGTAIIWTLNVLRIVLLISLGARGWPEVALGGFHSQAGWIAFNIVGLGLIAGSRRLALFSRIDQRDDRSDQDAFNPTAAYLFPMMAVLAAAMVTGAMSDGVFDGLYGARIAAGLAAIWCFQKAYAGWVWSWSGSAVAATLGLVVYLIWMALEPSTNADSARSLTIPTALAGMGRIKAGAWLTARVVGSVMVVPVVEELAFRGYLIRRLIAADFERVPFAKFTWPSFLVSSIAFGLMHQRWLAGTVAGMLYAAAVIYRGRLSDAVVAHATTNSLIAVQVLATGGWWLWT